MKLHTPLVDVDVCAVAMSIAYQKNKNKTQMNNIIRMCLCARRNDVIPLIVRHICSRMCDSCREYFGLFEFS